MAGPCDISKSGKICKTPKGRLREIADGKYCPPIKGDPSSAFTCDLPCTQEEICNDIQEGEYLFEGPATVWAVCNATKSYAIVKVIDDEDGECSELIVSALWPTGSASIATTGNYKVKYKWDACCEEELVVHHEAGCPCPSGNILKAV